MRQAMQALIAVGRTRVPLRIPRVTVRQMMALVAAVALLLGCLKARDRWSTFREQADFHAQAADGHRGMQAGSLRSAKLIVEEVDCWIDNMPSSANPKGCLYLRDMPSGKPVSILVAPGIPVSEIRAQAAGHAAEARTDAARFGADADRHDALRLWYLSRW